LLRQCRKVQQQQSSSPGPIAASVSVTTIPTSNPANRASASSDLKQAYYQKLQGTQSAASAVVGSSSSASLTLSEISEPLRNKLTLLDKNFQLFKAKNEPTDNFFASPKISQLIHSVDSLTKITATNSQNKLARQSRDFTLEFLSSKFEMTRDLLLKRISLIRSQHTTNQVANKIALLKKAIEEEMPKQFAKYKQMCDEYLRQRAATFVSSDANAEKKPSAPSKCSISSRRLMCF
jgi:hypothetical protein